MNKKLPKSITSNLNWVLTIAWLLFVVYLWFWSGIDHPTHLNEIGDFVAGMFAPVAFFWLVRGYYQQGEELKQNTEALRLQAGELKNAVEEQKRITQIYEDEKEAKHFSVMPMLDFKFNNLFLERIQDYIYDENNEAVDIYDDGYNKIIFSFQIFSQANTAVMVEVYNSTEEYIECQFPQIGPNVHGIANVELTEDEINNMLINDQFDFSIYIEYFDIYGKKFNLKIKFNVYDFEWSLKYTKTILQVLKN